jgi:hypothetical protein
MANDIIIYPSGNTFSGGAPFIIYEDATGNQLVQKVNANGDLTFSSSTDSSVGSIGTQAVTSNGFSVNDISNGEGIYAWDGSSSYVQIIK